MVGQENTHQNWRKGISYPAKICKQQDKTRRGRKYTCNFAILPAHFLWQKRCRWILGNGVSCGNNPSGLLVRAKLAEDWGHLYMCFLKKKKTWHVPVMVLCISISFNTYLVNALLGIGLEDWQNLFAVTRFRYIEVLFHVFQYWGVKEIDRFTNDFVI